MPPSKASGSETVIAQSRPWQIVSISNKTPGVAFATEELQKYLFQIGGTKLSISKKEKSDRVIVIGQRNEIPVKYKSLLPPQTPGYDGYTITISEKPACIIIAGENGPGVIYGVYDFLEHLGCRWFYPTQDANDPEVVPKLKTISLKPGSWSIASPIHYRICNGDSWFFNMDYAAAKKQTDWAMKNRYNAMGWQAATTTDKKPPLAQYKELESVGVLAEVEKRGMFIHGPAHSFDHFLKSEDYFDKHPEWFGMRNGKRVPQAALGAQFCWSNPEARKQFVTNAEEFITHAPLIHIFCTIPFDGGIACDCSECKKIGASNLLMILLGELVEKLKTSCPDVLVETVGGYGAVGDPPSNLDAIHPLQRVVWAQWGRHHGMGYNDERYDKKNLEKWRKAAKGGLTICQYYTDNFAEPWVMGPFAIAMESDRKYFLKNHIDSVYMLMYPAGYWWNHSLNGYIAGRCFYDVSLNPFDEIRDYAFHYYGVNGGPLVAQYYTEWAKQIDLSYRVRGDARKQDRVMLATQRTNLINPAVSAVKNDKLFAYRVAKVQNLHALAEHLAEAQRLHDMVLILRKQGKFEEASNVLAKARVYIDEVMALFYSLADSNQGLIERKEVPGFIKMAVKDWIDGEAKAISAKDGKIPSNPWKQLDETELLSSDVTPQ
jgi:Domain of unknown function (DUF4838)/Glycosyl hydrolase family 67 N-terminus